MTWPLRYIMNFRLLALFFPSASLQPLSLGFPLAIVLNTLGDIWLTQLTFFQIPAFCPSLVSPPLTCNDTNP